jgi:hypothetical protein
MKKKIIITVLFFVFVFGFIFFWKISDVNQSVGKNTALVVLCIFSAAGATMLTIIVNLILMSLEAAFIMLSRMKHK